MAFNVSGAGFGSPGAHIQDGPELKEIQTNELGFAAIHGESRVRLLPTPWPADDLPPPSASLLCVAPARGLLATAGPDALYVTSTKKVRDAFHAPPTEKNQATRSLDPDITLPHPRASHVVFSSDESVLVASPSSGGFVAFQVESLQNGQLDPALQISTNGQSLRAVIPNPVPDFAELFAVITAGGDLMMLDLKMGALRSGSAGTVLKGGASCLSWSNRGKQLAAGMADATVIQMKQDGEVVAQIPPPSSLATPSHVSGLSWLENDTFFAVYTPNDTSTGIQPSEYYIIQREPKTTNYTFQKLPEVLPPFGMERLPSCHFISRLRNFSPHLQDLLLVTATTTTDVGLITRADKALSQEDPVTAAYTFTTIEDDTRRAQLPLSSAMEDTSPIGMAVDLSSTDKVPNPIPSEGEILETAGPVPCLVILNNEGILVAWWIIYNDSVREKTTFSGLASIQTAKEPATAPAPATRTQPPAAASPSLAQPAGFGNFAKPSGSTFATFGTPATNSFGTSSPIAAAKPSWASSGFGSANNASSSGSAFGQPAFGSATPIGGNTAPAFGAAGTLASRTSAFGQTPALGGNPAFGQPSSFGAVPKPSPFASAESGFSSFSKGGGFSSFAGATAEQSKQSPFASAGGPSIFGKPSENTSSFGTAKASSPFAAVGSGAGAGASPFGAGGAFKIAPSFQGDASAKGDFPKPKESGGFGFESSFSDTLGRTEPALSPTRDQETDMDEQSDASQADSDKAQDSSVDRFSVQPPTKAAQTLVTPPSTLNQTKATPAPPLSNLFGRSRETSTTPQPQGTSAGWSFGALASTTPKETPRASHVALFGAKPVAGQSPAAVQNSIPVPAFAPIQSTPEIKQEPPSDDESVDLKDVPEAPLPPDPVSKPRYASGNTSTSSSRTPTEDAPLPPDFLPVPRAGQSADPNKAADQDLPSEGDDEFSSDFEDGDDDLEEEAGAEEDHTEEQTRQLQASPESSFKSEERSPETSPTEGLFTKASSSSMAQKPHRPLFGEVGPGPIFAPPKPQESPRSPSPVRQFLSTEGLRSDASRSVSAPAHPRSVIEQRKAEYQKSALAAQAAKTKEEEAARERARSEALAREQAQAEAVQLTPLEDDEDERLRQELEMPVSPAESLDDFVTYQSNPPEGTTKTGIPAQIERLYTDINSMVYTLGINCRSLSAFMRYQQPDGSNQSWPAVLTSETPLDALNDELLLADILRLHEGQAVLSEVLDDSQIEDYNGKVQQAQSLMNRDLFELRTKITSVRKSLNALSHNESATSAPLSAEQFSIQNDLRKAFTSVQTTLVQLEDGISVLRAKLARSSAGEASHRPAGSLGRTPSQKKPTVEAVTKTVGKMMAMAEQKSADIDLLEAQLKKLDLSMSTSGHNGGEAAGGRAEVVTPPRQRQSVGGASPRSPGSVYHTPDSKFGSSTRSSRGLRTSQSGGMAMVSAGDKKRWQEQAHRRKEVAGLLKEILDSKRKKTAGG